jgi:TRL-like protein family
MKKILTIITLIGSALLMSGCGVVYTGIKTPMESLSIPLDNTPGKKIGRASCKSYVWVVAVGDCSVKAAMENGNITKIHHVDTDIESILVGLYGRATTVVYGD